MSVGRDMPFEDWQNEIVHGNFLVHGNERDDVGKLLPSKSFDLCVTDPPYKIDYQSNMRKKKMEKIDGDSVFGKKLLNSSTRKIYNLLKNDSHFYCFTRWDTLPDLVTAMYSKFDIKNTLVVPSRGKGGMGDLKYNFSPSYEMVLFSLKGKREFSDTQIRKKKNGKGYIKRFPNFIDWLTVNVSKEEYRQHPNQKGLALIELFILLSSDKGGWVLDPFGGSGITAIACEELDRNYVVFEKSEYWYKKAIEYFEKYQNGELVDMVNGARGRLKLEKEQVTLSGF